MDEGRITAPLWERLGNNLRKADQAEPLPVGTIPIWSLVRGCLKEDKPSCREAIREGEEVLEDVREERSSARTSERGSERGGSTDEEGELSGEELEKHIRRLRIAQRKERPIPRSYPSLTQLRQQKEEEESEDTPLSTTLKPSLKMVPSAPPLPPASFAEPPLYHIQPCHHTCYCNQGLERRGVEGVAERTRKCRFPCI